MVEIPLLKEIAVVAAMAVVVSLAVARLRLPTVAGLLLCGALIGPHALGWVADTHAIEALAEVGVVLLLFTIGLEFSLQRLKHIFRHVALGGLLQVLGTFGLVAGGATVLGVASGPAVFYGFVFALSSTAIVLRALTERKELSAPHGRFIVGALIFQDLCVVPMVLIVPLLGEEANAGMASSIGLALLKAAAVVCLVLVVARGLVPPILHWVEAQRSRELFLLAVLALCIGTAWITSLAGLSLALGAFLGGLVVADTDYSHRALGDLLPLRDVFVSVFFVSLGMFFDIEVLLARPVLVVLLTVGFIIGKGAVATLSAMLMRFPPRAGFLAGVGLAQFGEFGFVLVKVGTQSDVVSSEDVKPLLCAGIISMFLTPLLLQRAPHLTAGEQLLAPLSKLLRARGVDELSTEQTPQLSDHVVLIGYGVAGQLVRSALQNLEVDHVVLELNAETVRRGQAAGAPVFYADATSEEALNHAHLREARCVVLMINDPLATIRVVETVQRVAPSVPIIVRTHFVADQQRFIARGVSRVVAEEAEGGLEALTHVLRELDVPRNRLTAEVEAARTGTGSQRPLSAPRKRWTEANPLSSVKVESIVVSGDSAGAFQTLRHLNLQATTGALLVALQRGEDTISHPEPDTKLSEGDVAYLIGNAAAIRKASHLLAERREVDGDLDAETPSASSA